jgi:hypothetical protein
MESHKLCVKLFADGAAGLPLGAFVPVFHGWIRDQSLPEHLLIDVADYAHVPGGPGTVLVAHEANIHFDRADGAPGLLYVRKQPVAAAGRSFRRRLASVFRAALQAAEKLQAEPALGGLRFRGDEAVFRVNDRLLAPNNEATFSRISPDLQAFVAELYRGDAALEHKHDAERLFEVRIKSTASASVTELLARLERSTAELAPAR